MAKTTKTQLKEIAERGARTEAQRAFIVTQSQELGIPFRVTSCSDCYRDQAVILWRTLCERDIPKSRKYVLRVGKDVVWRGRRVNATCSDEELKALLEAGFPSEFFYKIDGKCV